MNFNYTDFDDPQCQLMVAFANKNSELFEVALDCGAKADLQVHGQLSFFEKALSTPGYRDIIKICVEHNCQVNPELNRSALSYAAESRHCENLDALLGSTGLGSVRRINSQLDTTYDHLTPLNFLAKNLTEENALEVKRCIGYLLECGASPNIPDQNGHPPLYHVLNTTFESIDIKMNIVKLFLEHEFLDIESYCNGEMCRMINEQFPMLLHILEFLEDEDKDVQDIDRKRSRAFSILVREQSPSIIDMDRLQVTLKGGDENMFQEQFAEFIKNCSTFSIDKVTDMLKFSIQDHRKKVVQAILTIVNGYKNSVVFGSDLHQIALECRNLHAIKTLMMAKNVKPFECGLHEYLKLVKPFVRNKLETLGFLDVILDRLREKINVDINDKGWLSNFVKGHPRIMFRLLNIGAYLSSNIKHIPLDVLEEHLDSCLSVTDEGKHYSEIFVNLSSLKAIGDKKVSQGDEMAPIAYIAESKKMHQFLKHPVILTFLSAKWQERFFFILPDLIINFIIYISIGYYILLKCFHNHNINGGCSRNSSESGSEFSLELNGSRYGLEPNGSGYSLELEGSCYSLEPNESVYSLQLNGSEYLMCNSVHFAQIQSSSISVTPLYMVLFRATCLVLIAYLAVREITQFIILKSRYIYSLKNLLDVTSVLLSVYTCIIDINSQSDRALACFTILLALLELCTILCFLPNNFIATRMLMFREASFSLIKALIFYSIFLLVFYVCFIILFDKGKPFLNGVVDFVKIFAMMTGEMNFNEYKITDTLTALFFLAFIMIITIVIMNLMYGLAIHDNQVIKKQAELNKIICRINLLCQYDRGLKSIYRILTWRCVPERLSYFIERRLDDACSKRNIFLQGANLRDKFTVKIGRDENGLFSKKWSMGLDYDIFQMSLAVINKRSSMPNQKIKLEYFAEQS